MDKKSGNLLLLATVLGLIIFSVIYFLDIFPRLQQAQINMDSYLLAKKCEDSKDCRKDAQIKTLEVKKEISNKKYKYDRNFFSHYFPMTYKLALEENKFEFDEIVVLTNIDLENKDYGIPNLYIPGDELFFIDLMGGIFPIEENLILEIWNNEPTLIYTTLTDVENIGSCVNKECAIPTVDNPIVQYWLIKNEFEGFVGLVIGVALFLLIIVLVKTIWVSKMENAS